MCLKVFWVFAFIGATCCGTRVAGYDTKYDSIDLDEVFKSTRLLNNYLNCLKNLGPCTPDAVELKDKLPDALESDCEHCSEKQKTGADKVIHFIIENRPEDFRVLESLYDPTGEYRRKYLDERQQFRQPPEGSSGETDEEESTNEAGSGAEETEGQEQSEEASESN
ncbi:ejaculatory bulb-specific protein 3-like [Wyeomyia smithii]|uniref:ejaculatory bulb-specific protein 3-like n=1 Tax=Wyeomyia smithii TaxID=174621 RepID=UPI002467FB02|nr:ejaculatory bulb-specific protein 3-like [Wyeomyia smithii]